MIKLRIEGTRKELSSFCPDLEKKGLKIKQISKFYPNRENEFMPLIEQAGRVYVEVEFDRNKFFAACGVK